MIDNRKINIDDMIKCVEREIGMRERVYPRWIEQKKMSQEKADLEIRTKKVVVIIIVVNVINNKPKKDGKD